MTPRAGVAARARRSGVSRRTVPESATSTSTSETPRWTPTGATPRAATRPAGGSTWKIRTSPLGADEAGDGGGGLGHLGVGVGRAGGHRLPHTVVHVVLQQFEGHRLQRPGGSRDLGEDVDAVAVFVDHPLQAPDLALDPAEALLDGVLVG